MDRMTTYTPWVQDPLPLDLPETDEPAAEDPEDFPAYQARIRRDMADMAAQHPGD